MARSYPNSGDIQPRYAAWLGSLGLPTSFAGQAEAHRRFGSNIAANRNFIAWILRCKLTAGSTVRGGRIVDHDAFTEHCWKVAFGDVIGMVA